MYIDTRALILIKPCLYYSQTYDKNFFMNLHQHDTLEIMYVSSGSMFITTVGENFSEKNIPVFQGQFVIIKENLPHKISFPHNAVIFNMEFESFSTNKSISELFFYNPLSSNFAKTRDYCLKQKSVIVMEDTHHVLQSLTRLQEEISIDNLNPNFELSYTLLLSQFITDILNCKNISNDKKSGNLYVKKAMEYISINLHKEVSLSNICEYANCSKAYLEKSFKDEFSCTVSKKINELRIEKAKSLLKNSNILAEEVSKLVGFNNKQSFINNFKEMVGITPTKYKKQQKYEYKILRAYEKSYFDEKFEKIFNYSTGSFIVGKKWKIAIDNRFVNTVLYSDKIENFFEKDKNKILQSGKFVFFNVKSILSDNGYLLNFNEKIIENNLFSNFLGFYINYEIHKENLFNLIIFLHQLSPTTRIILDCEEFDVNFIKSIENTHVTDVIFPKNNTPIQSYIVSKLNIWIKQEIKTVEEIDNSLTLPIKNFGGIVYDFIK